MSQEPEDLDGEVSEEFDELGGPTPSALLRAITLQNTALQKLLKQQDPGDFSLGVDLGSSSSASSGVRGSVNRTKLQRLLQSRPGHFSGPVRQNMQRRMGASFAGGSASGPSLYLEGFGSFAFQHEKGPAFWLLGRTLRTQ